MEKLTQEYKEHLKNLDNTNIEVFVGKVKEFKDSKDSYFRKIEEYLNQAIPREILNLWDNEDFTKLFYLDAQAKHILNKFKISETLLDVLKTLVYCYNTNQREFEKRKNEDKLKVELTNRGFREQEILNKEEIKKLDGLKVFCVMDVSKIGLLGSFDKKEELEGTLVYSEHRSGLMLIPKRCRTRGYVIIKKFYYKEVKK